MRHGIMEGMESSRKVVKREGAARQVTCIRERLLGGPAPYRALLGMRSPPTSLRHSCSCSVAEQTVG